MARLGLTVYRLDVARPVIRRFHCRIRLGSRPGVLVWRAYRRRAHDRSIADLQRKACGKPRATLSAQASRRMHRLGERTDRDATPSEKLENPRSRHPRQSPLCIITYRDGRNALAKTFWSAGRFSGSASAVPARLPQCSAPSLRKARRYRARGEWRLNTQSPASARRRRRRLVKRLKHYRENGAPRETRTPTSKGNVILSHARLPVPPQGHGTRTAPL